jgi:hypothetical protein
MRNFTAILCFLALLVSGCATNSSWRYLDDKDQLTSGVKDEAPLPNKAHLVITTNSWLQASFYTYKGGDLCKPNQKNLIATVARHGYYDGQGAEAVNATRAVLSLGLTKMVEGDPRKPKIPHIFTYEINSADDLIIEVSSFGRDGNTTQSCGPLFVKLFPENGKRYQLSMNMDNGRCIAIPSILSTVATPIKYASWSCSPSFMGVGGGEISGYREFLR